MRTVLYDRSAKKRSVNLTINSDLYAKAKSAGVNASQVAEEALAEALSARLTETIRQEIRQDLEAYNAYIERHGSPAAMAREHYSQDDDAV